MELPIFVRCALDDLIDDASYTTAQLRDTLHDFALPDNDFVNICIDLAMRGVGSHSCGPKLPPQYEIPRSGKNTFRVAF